MRSIMTALVLQPAIILVTPQLGENIGAAARVMANFGLLDLRLVAPRDGWPNPAADTMSAGALDGVVVTRLFETVVQAIADCGLVFAATARARGLEKPVLDLAATRARISAASTRAGILFGAERTGLSNEAVTLADAILSYPVNPAFTSLNLAQAVAVFAHGWAEGQGGGLPPRFDGSIDAPATREHLIGMMEHFERELDRAGFFLPEVKRAVMVQNLRNAFTRGGWTEQEVRTFRGAIKALALGRGKHRVVREE